MFPFIISTFFAIIADQKLSSHKAIIAPLSPKLSSYINRFPDTFHNSNGVFTDNPSTNTPISVFDTGCLPSGIYDKLSQISSIFLFYQGTKLTESEENIRDKCAYTLYIPDSDNNNLCWDSTINQLAILLDRIDSGNSVSNPDAIFLDAGLWSHFVSLTFPSIEKALPFLPAIRIGADALELRVDLLEDQSVEGIHAQIALLRKYCNLPIVFTVRSDGQIGKFPSDPEKIFKLLLEGLRAGIEFVDVESCWPEGVTKAFCSYAVQRYSSTSKLLGSLHVTTPQSKDSLQTMFSACDLYGYASIAKVVSGAASDEDCHNIHEVGESYEKRTGKPYIGLCLGLAGQLSRVLNRRFTPVSHEVMAAAAPGQLPATELMKRRSELGLKGTVPKKMFLFGSPISKSLSPAMHNAAFQTLLLPHIYGLNEKPLEDCDQYSSILADSSFGGASVTIPHKESIMNLVDEVQGAAQEIGAVNTILVVEADDDGGGKKKLVGMNTDWKGILIPVEKQLRRRGKDWRSGGIGLVIGAGGTARAACYAVKQLGLKLVVYNRTPEKAEELAKRHNGIAITDLNQLIAENDGSTISEHIHLIVSTVPGSAELVVPDELLNNLPVVLDVVYRPARTALLSQALLHKCFVVQGATMLFEQAKEQFQLWTSRRAPGDVMEAALFKDLEKITS